MVRRAKKTKRKTRARNPKLARNVRQHLNRAVGLYRKFREAEPRYVDTVRVNPTPPALMEIGKLDGVLYTTTHGGKKTAYIHRFSGASKPTLAADGKGRRLYVIGGKYNFTADGIVDRKS
jgi:hypothetical protein